MNTEQPHQDCGRSRDPKKQRGPWERALKLCLHSIATMETPGWQPTQKASPMEGELAPWLWSVTTYKFVIMSKILCCYTIHLLSYVYFLIWTCLVLCDPVVALASWDTQFFQRTTISSKRRAHKESAECPIKKSGCSEHWYYQDTGQGKEVSSERYYSVTRKQEKRCFPTWGNPTLLPLDISRTQDQWSVSL